MTQRCALYSKNRKKIVCHTNNCNFPLAKTVFSPIIALPLSKMVVVAQLVEPRIVIPVVAGSSPVDHPIFPAGSYVFRYSANGVRAGEKET
jgi:hypothetical protein